jgi:hypothetical protein
LLLIIRFDCVPDIGGIPWRILLKPAAATVIDIVEHGRHFDRFGNPQEIPRSLFPGALLFMCVVFEVFVRGIFSAGVQITENV